MGVVILGDLFQFPEGGAATNRVYTYAKGLKECGVNVYIICFGNDYVPQRGGVIEGIKYDYPFAQQKRNKNFLVRRWQTAMKYSNAYAFLKRISKTEKIDAIISYSNFTLTHIYASFLAKRFGAKLLNECNEHPLRYYQKGLWKKRQGLAKNFVEAYVADGIICISDYLVNFFRQHGVKEEKLFLLPSTVDPSRFVSTGVSPMNKPYVGYFGSLTFERDNIDLLIKAFAKANPFHPDVFLVLGGFCTVEEKRKIETLIDSLKIKDKVRLLQVLTRLEITQYITHASLLAMVRAKDLQSDASYPSKLSEFLATGKPVVAVKVGDVSKYLTDNVNSFLVEPGDVDGLAKKIDFVLTNHEQAKQVGQNGYELATTTFHYHFQAKRLLDFIRHLRKEKTAVKQQVYADEQSMV